MGGYGEGFLKPYRVIDLTDHRGLLAGHMLAQMGADVVQVEPPEGNAARRLAPFAPDWPEGERSLFWATYAAGKRSIVADPGHDGALWDRLLQSADMLIESRAPAQGRPVWLDPGALAERYPHLIHISITPFGLEGPKHDWPDSEITLWAAGGPLLLTRDHDDRPLRISVPQAYLHAGATAVSAALIALADRTHTGLGQHVDLAVVQTLPQCTLGAVLAEGVGHADFVPRRKAGDEHVVDLSGSGSITRKSKWTVSDGLAEMHLGIGPAAGPASNKLMTWMRDEGWFHPIFSNWDWSGLHEKIIAGDVSEADLDAVRAWVQSFLATRHKDELVGVAMERGVRIAPILTVADLAESAQFAARDFIQTIDGPFGPYRMPGAFARGCPEGFVQPRPAPRLGEHDAEVREEWLEESLSLPCSAVQGGASGRPLGDLRVLDLAWVVAGPLIGRTLADFGATVVRVESSRRVETARVMGPFPGGRYDVQQSALFETCNAGKLGLSLDLSKEAAREVVRDLVRWADVLVESFTPGQMAKWNLSYEELSAINPRLVMVSTSLSGQDGPDARYSGYGNHGAALSGFQYIVGAPGGPLVGPYGPYTDFVAPRFGLAALLAALDHRRRTGKGCHLDISQVEAGVQFLAPQIAASSVTGEIQGAVGNRDALMAPHGVFRAAGDDQWIALAVEDDGQWRDLARLMGGAELEQDQRFATAPSRRVHVEALEAIVEAWTAGREVEWLEQSLRERGIPAHRVQSIYGMGADPQMQARGHLIRIDHPLSGTATIEAVPFRLSRTPARYDVCAPPYGRDNDRVLRGILGYGEDRLEALAAADALV
ncbi:CoA transferase [Sphingobium amiense]|uniref:CoA transferase n=1 Tax=Sphingobium amiense TaxID=135719 RepID=A0A494W092_9SPHN|nr:CoA transferase [Sphingobium amiense]BBD98084.1 CoA transferase [Sphingobium amiense]